MHFEWKHSIVEEAKGNCSATVTGAPVGYFEERFHSFLARGITSTLSLTSATAEKMPDAPAVMTKTSSGYTQMTFRELLKAARQLAQGLIEGSYCTESIYNGKKIRMLAIFIDDCLDCFVADFAAQYVPAVTVFLHNRQEDALIVGLTNFPFDTIIINARCSEVLANFMEQKKCRVFPNLVFTDDIPLALKERLIRLGVKTVAMSLLQANTGDAVTVPKLEPSEPLTMLMTSGSTGQPKFVLAPSRVVLNMFAYGWGTFLPPGVPYFFGDHYSYSSPRLIGACFLAAGNPIVLGKEIVEETLACVKETRPAGVLWAPLYLAKIYEYAQKEINEMPEPEAQRLRTAIEKKIAFSKETKRLHHEALDLELQEYKMRLFGNSLKSIYWSGAPLPEELRWFFQAVLGCPLIGLYGQLEVAGHITIQEPFDDPTIIGHITPPYLLKLLNREDIGYSIDDVIDGKKRPRGELLVKGPTGLTFYNNDAEFKKLFYDGEWFRTNDIMELDLDKLTFRLIDRGNNILRTLLFVCVPVAEHERMYEKSKYVRQNCIYIDARSPSILAIVVPHEEPLRALAQAHGIQGTFPNLCRNELIQKEVLADLRAVATQANIVLGKQVIGVILSPTPFSVENGLLTATYKIRRASIYAFYREDILALRKKLEGAATT